MKRFALFALKFLVSALLLYFAVSRMNFSMIAERLNGLEFGWLLLAVAVGFVQTAAGAKRWQYVAVLCNAAMSTRRAIQFNLIGAFFNQLLPSTIGGDAARIILLNRTGTSAWNAAYSVLIDRFVGVLILAALVTGGLYWSFALIANPLGRIVLLAVGLGSMAAAAVFLSIGLLPTFVQWRLVRRLADISAHALRVLSSGGRSLSIILLSVIIHAMTALIAWMAARAIMSTLSYVDAFLLVLPVLLLANIPISIAGWGVRESALVLAFSYAGLPEGDGLLVSVLLGGVLFVIGLAGGVTWLLSPMRGTTLSANNPPERN